MRISACHFTRAARQLGAFSRLGLSSSASGGNAGGRLGSLCAANAAGSLSARSNLVNTRA